MNKNLIFIFACVLILGLGASWVISKANSSHNLPVVKQVPSFSFITQDGDPFSEKDLIGKATVLDFIFTSCAGPCPIMTNYMNQLYQDYKEVTEVQFVSITVDPMVDDEEMLQQYAAGYNVEDDRWQFLTSDLDAIKDLKKNGFLLYADELPQGHAIKFVLIDQEGQIRKYYDGTDEASIAILRTDLNNLVKKIRF